jgi:hypothetical protein
MSRIHKNVGDIHMYVRQDKITAQSMETLKTTLFVSMTLKWIDYPVPAAWSSRIVFAS